MDLAIILMSFFGSIALLVFGILTFLAFKILAMSIPKEGKPRNALQTHKINKVLLSFAMYETF